MKHGPLLALALAALALGAGLRDRPPSSPAAEAPAAAATAVDPARAAADGRYLREAAEIEAAYRSDQERCQALATSARAVCLEQARSDYSRKLAEAQTRRAQYASGNARKKRRPAPIQLMC